MNRPLALIIDDEPDIRELLEITLARMDVDSRSAANIGEAIERLNAERYALCLATWCSTSIPLPSGSRISTRHRA